MPSKHKEIPFKLNLGMDSYNPSISDDVLKLQDLKNLHPRDNRLYSAYKQKEFQTMTGSSGQVTSFSSYVLDNQPASAIYALSLNHAYYFDTATQVFVRMQDVAPAAFSWDNPTYKPFSAVPWGQKIYITRRLEELKSLSGSQVDNTIDSSDGAGSGQISAMYAIESAGHLMLLNTFEGGADQALRVRWSDLDSPEDFATTIGLGGESDSYDLARHSGFITGASNQRGFTYIYTYNDVWRARYTAGRTVAGVLSPYTFEPIFTGLGNIYHHAVARVKQVDFFIGQDNFYMLDGLNPIEIGDDIWKFFKETRLNITYNESVLAHVDQTQDEIFWVYPTNLAGKELWSVVYNYKENKWSNRDPQNMFASYLPLVKPKTYYAIDDFTLIDYGTIETFDSEIPPGGNHATTMIDGDWQYLIAPFIGLYGNADPDNTAEAEVYEKVTDEFAMYDDSAMECEIETYELNLTSYFAIKEIVSMKFLYEQTGSVNVKLEISTRNNQSEDFTVSDELELTSQLEGYSEFFFDSFGVGHFVKFRIFWDNTDTNYITEVYGLSLNVRVPIEDDVEE